eukprot:scaffold20974_cov32-Tisochrysis_lutea.AAC.2
MSPRAVARCCPKYIAVTICDVIGVGQIWFGLGHSPLHSTVLNNPPTLCGDRAYGRFCNKLTCEYRLSIAEGGVLPHPRTPPSYSGAYVLGGLLLFFILLGICCICAANAAEPDVGHRGGKG